MQSCSRGLEHGATRRGCGGAAGVVERLRAPIVPHMGWNTVEPGAGSRLFAGIEDERFYFVHSYGVRDWVLSAAAGDAGTGRDVDRLCGRPFVSAAEHGPLWATQFHPEKSGDAGALLQNWLATLSTGRTVSDRVAQNLGRSCSSLVNCGQ